MVTKPVSATGAQQWRNEKGELHREDGPAVIYSDGSRIWYQNGERHREDGPAVIKSNEYEAWFQYGKLHREDGPAVINPDGGYQAWYFRGNCHREDGPAIIRDDGRQYWYQNGIQVEPSLGKESDCGYQNGF